MSHNSSCPVHTMGAVDPTPLFSNGNINFAAHDVGWIICGILATVAIAASLWLILKHLSFFYCPAQQVHIVRILLMVPIYAIASFCAYFWYEEALYFQLGRDCYEAFVLLAFFNLLLSYLSSPPPTSDNPIPKPYETEEERQAALREVFRDLKVGRWMWPFGWVKWRPAGGGPGEGETFLWLMRIGIGQYVIIRPLSTLASVVGEALGVYCLTSWSPTYVHLYTAILITVSVSIAMYCVLQLYMPLTKELAPFRPVLKFLAVKAVIFLMFWQEVMLGLLETFGLIVDHQYWTAGQIVIGISSLLSCFEMMCFAFLHIKAFTYLPYRALANPLRPASHSPTASTCSYPDPIPRTFSEWTAWEQRKSKSLKDKSRLVKPSVGKGEPTTKPDGTPFLHQTRKWPAFWIVFNVRDIFIELADEIKFVFSSNAKKNAGVVDRRDHFESALGRKRAAPDDEDSSYDRGSIEKDLVRLRDREEGEKPERGRVGVDGRTVPRESRYGDSSRRGQGQPLLKEEGRWEQERGPGRDFEERVEAERGGWWASLRGRGGRDGGERGFYQLERQEERGEERGEGKGEGRGEERERGPTRKGETGSQEPSRFAPPSSRMSTNLATSLSPASYFAPPPQQLDVIRQPRPSHQAEPPRRSVSSSNSSRPSNPSRHSTPSLPSREVRSPAPIDMIPTSDDIPYLTSSPRPISLPPPHRLDPIHSASDDPRPSTASRSRRHSNDPTRIVAPSDYSSPFSERRSTEGPRHPVLIDVAPHPLPPSSGNPQRRSFEPRSMEESRFTEFRKQDRRRSAQEGRARGMHESKGLPKGARAPESGGGRGFVFEEY